MQDREQFFLELIDENRSRIHRICKAYASESAAREDLFQEILMQVWRALPGYRGDSLPGTWLYRIALNTAISAGRRDARRRETAFEDGHPMWEDTAPGPARRLEDRERLERLYRAIARLDEIDRALITMFLDERSYREMADVLGVTENYVGVRLHRARKRLSAMLMEDRP